jgi:cysteine desulfurase
MKEHFMSNGNRVYLDYAASTPVDPLVMEAMLPYFTEIFANSSATHYDGQRAEAGIDEARETIAKQLHCATDEIIFTSGGSESDNLALRGAALAGRSERSANHVLITPVEHQAVGSTARQLAEVYGFEVEEIPVNSMGQVDPQRVADRIRKDTAVVSAIYGNNEIGTINPVGEIARICAEKGIPFHTDAVQAAAYLPIDLSAMPVSLMSGCAHKFYGPKGAGFLFKRKEIHLVSQQRGGNHEFKLRAGTHNTPGIVGMGAAFKLLYQQMGEYTAHYTSLRDRLIEGVLKNIPDAQLTGSPALRLPNHASFVFEGIPSNTLVMMLDAAGYACSSGSACKSGNPTPSTVLLAMGYPERMASGSLRVTVGRQTTLPQVELFLEKLQDVVQYLRK